MKALAGALLVLGALLGLWASGSALDRQQAARDACPAFWYAGQCVTWNPGEAPTAVPTPYPSDLNSATRLMCDSLLPDMRAAIEVCQ